MIVNQSLIWLIYITTTTLYEFENIQLHRCTVYTTKFEPKVYIMYISALRESAFGKNGAACRKSIKKEAEETNHNLSMRFIQ